jgi:alpha-1,6-mannosyltransferase
MRICDVNNFYSPTGGGVRVYHERKLEYFAERPQHTYALLVPGEREAVRRVGHALVYELPARPIGSAGYRVITSRRALARVFRDFAPDLIEIGSPYLLPWLVPAALGGRDVATVGFVHADYPGTYVEPALARLPALAALAGGLARGHMGLIYRRMSATFGASEHVLRRLAALGLDRLFHTPLGVETERFRPSRRSQATRARFGVARGDQLILFIGRLSAEKGVDLLLAASPQIVGARRHLVIAGHGPQRARVAAVSAAHPDAITQHEAPLSRDEVAELIASADLFLALGAHETFSLTTLEALACGTPVVAPAAGGAAELIDRYGGGRTFHPGDSAALAAAIDRALADPRPEPALAERIAAAHAWPAVFDRITRFYQAILDAHRARAPSRLRAPAGWWPADASFF